jgi:hypothetical protein
MLQTTRMDMTAKKNKPIDQGNIWKPHQKAEQIQKQWSVPACDKISGGQKRAIKKREIKQKWSDGV